MKHTVGSVEGGYYGDNATNSVFHMKFNLQNKKLRLNQVQIDISSIRNEISIMEDERDMATKKKSMVNHTEKLNTEKDALVAMLQKYEKGCDIIQSQICAKITRIGYLQQRLARVQEFCSVKELKENIVISLQQDLSTEIEKKRVLTHTVQEITDNILNLGDTNLNFLVEEMNYKKDEVQSLERSIDFIQVNITQKRASLTEMIKVLNDCTIGTFLCNLN